MPVEHDLGIVVRVSDWSETSQTAAIFTERHGLVRVLAKGSKRPKSQYSGGLELLTLGTCGLIVKPSSELALLTEWDLHETFAGLRLRLARYHAAMYVADVIGQLIVGREASRTGGASGDGGDGGGDGDAHGGAGETAGFFGAIRSALYELAVAEHVAPALVRFSYSAVLESGLQPELTRYVDTGEVIGAEQATVLFDASAGGPIQGVGGGAAGGVEGGGGQHAATGRYGRSDQPSRWKVRVATLRCIAAMVGEPANRESVRPAAVGAAVTADPQTTERAAKLLACYVRYVIGAPLASLTMLYPDLG